MKNKPRTVLWGGGAVAVLAVGGVVAMLLTSVGRPGAASLTPTASWASASPSSAVVPLPRVAIASGAVAGWSLAQSTQIAGVLPEVGDAADGAVALAVDAPVVEHPTVAASISVPVIAGDVYEVSAKARVLSSRHEAPAATLMFGPQAVKLPALDARWTEIKSQVEASTGRIVVALQIDGPVVGLDLDDVRVVGPNGVNVVPNSSFETVTGASKIANESLILSSGTAAIAVALPRGVAQWKLTRGNSAMDSGTLLASGGLQAIPLQAPGAGYFIFSVTDVSGATTSTPIVVLDRDLPPHALDSRFGVGAHLEKQTYAAAARYARSLGIASVRSDIAWKFNERKRGVYDFAPFYTSGFARLHVNGVDLLGIVDYGNKLYGNDRVPDNPTAIAAYGRYAAEIVKQFHPAALEVYNEFNLKRLNPSVCGVVPQCYMPLLTSVHDQIRAVDPNVAVVAGATANYDAPWLNGLWGIGGLNYSDAISYHPYQVTRDPDALAAIVVDSQAGMQQNGGATKPVWITELGTPTTPEWGPPEDQATYVLKATVTALGHGVEKLHWYDLINDGSDPHSLEDNFGLFGSPIDGVSALPPKPAAFAEALMIDQLQGKAAASSSPLKEGVMSYKFGTGAESVTVAWAPAGDTTVDYKTTKAVEVVRADGQVTTVKPEHGVAVVSVPTTGVFIRSSAAAAK